MYDEKVSQVALSLAPGIGDVLIKQLIAYCGSAGNVFTEKKGKLRNIPRIGNVLSSVINSNLFGEAEKLVKLAEKHEIDLLFYTDPDYPSRLKQVHAAPSLLWFRGEKVFENRKSVAIVGTRRATAYGKSTVIELIEGLKHHGACIVSGLAYGIDIESHRCALKNNLSTIAVIAGGLNHIYPQTHFREVRQMQANGGVMSEQAWDIIPEAHHFPRRNRIIAGLADVTLVIEAASKGGALITAEYAHSFNRDIFAVPGNLNQKYSEGCNHLIETLKANIYTGIESLEKVMNWDIVERPVPVKKDLPDTLSSQEISILEVMDRARKGIGMDEISWRSQTPINRLAVILLNLELKGIVKSLPGNLYKLN